MPLDLDEVIKALAHPVRRDILNWLKDPHTHFPEQYHSLENGVCAGQIDQRCGLSQSDCFCPLSHAPARRVDQQPKSWPMAFFQTQ